jgi:hypothetical protein
MLNIVRSNLRYPFQVAFLGLHGIGTMFGLAFNSKTPDLYPNNSHNKIGWILSVLTSAHFLVGILKTFISGRTPNSGPRFERAPFLTEANPEEADRIVGQSSSSRNTSQYPERSECSANETDAETLVDIHLHYTSRIGHRYDGPMSWNRRWAIVSRPHFLIQSIEIGYMFLDRSLAILGFVAVCTGIVTMAGIFVSTERGSCF